MEDSEEPRGESAPLPAAATDDLSLTKEDADGEHGSEPEDSIDKEINPEPEKGIQEPANEPEQETKGETTEATTQATTTDDAYLAPVTPGSVKLWLEKMHWHANPFTFSINPNLFVGYRSQTSRLLVTIEERHKFLLVLGPTGSGKTTLAKWLANNLSESFDVSYIGKPPATPEEFVRIINAKYPKPWYAFWKHRLESIYQVPDFLNSRLKQRHLVILLDEAHEASTEILEWLRVLNDQVERMSVVLFALGNFEDELKSRLETFAKRITAKAELLSLTKEETGKLVEKRIQSVGGRGDEFDGVVDKIYDYTGGFPREVIRVCDKLVNSAIAKGKLTLDFDLHEKREEEKETRTVSASLVDRMTPMQKEILEFLSKRPATPGQIANSLDLGKYKSRQHAVRSVNNVMKSLFEDGMLERRRVEKAFVYSLAPKISTLFVKR